MPTPDVQSLEQELGKEYLTEVMVTPQSTTVGLTLDQLDWAKRQDVTIVGVIREGERMPPNALDEIASRRRTWSTKSSLL